MSRNHRRARRNIARAITSRITRIDHDTITHMLFMTLCALLIAYCVVGGAIIHMKYVTMT